MKLLQLDLLEGQIRFSAMFSITLKSDERKNTKNCENLPAEYATDKPCASYMKKRVNPVGVDS